MQSSLSALRPAPATAGPTVNVVDSLDRIDAAEAVQAVDDAKGGAGGGRRPQGAAGRVHASDLPIRRGGPRGGGAAVGARRDAPAYTSRRPCPARGVSS